MEKLSYEHLLSSMSHADKERFECALIFEKIQELFKTEEILFFYPKAIFSDNLKTEIIFITKGNKLIIAKEDGFNLEFQSKRLESVEDCLYQKKHPLTVSLKISFKDGFELILNSKDDSNQHWHSTYVNLINTIFHYLIQK